jgi:hypothetical protein
MWRIAELKSATKFDNGCIMTSGSSEALANMPWKFILVIKSKTERSMPSVIGTHQSDP